MRPAAFNVAGLKSSFTHNTLPCNFKTGLFPASMDSIANPTVGDAKTWNDVPAWD